MTQYMLSVSMLAAVLALCFSLINISFAQQLPYEADTAHLGVSTCGDSTCHGSIQSVGDIRRGEYIIWKEDDTHSIAYEVLLDDQAVRIARNLGLSAAHESDVCLACHSDFVPKNLRGTLFKLEDGVGCEACHGGAQHYLETHDDSGVSHLENIEQGLYPTEDPVARAELCLSCHLGNEDKFITHRIMAAGHPRIGFELDAFSDLQPAHFVGDEDYKKRKRLWSNVQTWAIGQIMASQRFVKSVAAGRNTGLFPDLTLFDCQSCHRSMDNPQWRPSKTKGLAPGAIRFNDANLLMSYHLSRVVAPSIAADLHLDIKALHQAAQSDRQSVVQTCNKLNATLAKIHSVLISHEFSSKDMMGIINGVIKEGLNGEYRDFSIAEQAFMAIDSNLRSLEQVGAFNPDTGDVFFEALNQIFTTLSDVNAFSPDEFKKALKSFNQKFKI